MENWNLSEDEDIYYFNAKDNAAHLIKSITISILNGAIMTHVVAYNPETFCAIIKAGMEYAIEKNRHLPYSQQKDCYFDNGSNDFERMKAVNRTQDLNYPLGIEIGRINKNIYHTELCDSNDTQVCSSTIIESLNVLANVDDNVREIIDYIGEKYSPGTFVLK